MPGNPFTEFMSAADRQARGLLGVPGVFRRAMKVYAEASVITSPAMEYYEYCSGGAEYVVKMTASVRKDAFPEGEAPEQGDFLTCHGMNYHVAGISTTSADPLWTLQLGIHK